MTTNDHPVLFSFFLLWFSLISLYPAHWKNSRSLFVHSIYLYYWGFLLLHTARPNKNCHHFAEGIFKCTFRKTFWYILFNFHTNSIARDGKKNHSRVGKSVAPVTVNDKIDAVEVSIDVQHWDCDVCDRQGGIPNRHSRNEQQWVTRKWLAGSHCWSC